MQIFKAYFPNDRVYSHFCLFPRKRWASKVICRGSVAGVLVERVFRSNPPQKPEEGDGIRSLEFLGNIACKRLFSWEAAPAGFWEALCANPPSRGGMPGSRREDTCYCSYYGRSTPNRDVALTTKAEQLLPQEINQLILKPNLCCLS